MTDSRLRGLACNEPFGPELTTEQVIFRHEHQTPDLFSAVFIPAINL